MCRYMCLYLYILYCTALHCTVRVSVVWAQVMEGKAPNGLDLKMLAVFVATLDAGLHTCQTSLV